MLRYFSVLIIVFSSLCSCSQTDQILLSDKMLQVNVYQSDLDNYLAKKKIKDTTGRTLEFIGILRDAKFMSKLGPGSGIAGTPMPFEKALKQAEENFIRRHLVDKVLVIKSKRKLYLLKKGDTVQSFQIALGPNPVGQKEFEGDGRTPEGSYVLDWQRWETPVFHSFHISYPNRADSVRAKTRGLTPGSNIMVHGTSKGLKKKKDWTNGCIGLTNPDMLSFRKIVFQDTPIEIRK